MQIRHATIHDLDRLIEMLEHFANAAPLNSFSNPEYDLHRIKRILGNFLMKGCVLVSVENDTIGGMLIAGITPDVWLPEIKTLREYAWWVEPEYRNTTMGYRLLKEYLNVGEKLKKANVITDVVITTMINSPDLKLEKRGWRTIETNYVYEGV